MIIKTFLSVLSIIFSLLMLYITNLNYKKNILKKTDTIIWSLVWISIIFISIRPKIIDNYFIKNFNVDVFYIISVLSIMILVIVSYFSLVKIKILEKKIDTIIRADSLKEILEKIKD
tara:strand:+ start:1314 stop:1664 length:351 start_codon:yes stop_codon:yes gene_type:complete